MIEAIELTVNGERRRIETDPARTLLEVLRDDLGLTGTKYGCGEGQCGACTVHVGGQPRRSCLVRVGAAAGADVRTIEGLAAAGGALHPAQQAFLDAGAFQCGYCTPGLVMTVASLVDAPGPPAEGDLARALNAHLCRCCVHPRILEAAAKAVKSREVKPK